jgi:hypothetical protein
MNRPINDCAYRMATDALHVVENCIAPNGAWMRGKRFWR